jgi:hypothetical protein
MVLKPFPAHFLAFLNLEPKIIVRFGFEKVAGIYNLFSLLHKTYFNSIPMRYYAFENRGILKFYYGK